MRPTIMHYPETTNKATFSLGTLGNGYKQLKYENIQGKGIKSFPVLQTPQGSAHILQLAQSINPSNQTIKLKQQSDLLDIIALHPEKINELKNTYGEDQVKYLANQAYRNFIEQTITPKFNYANTNSQKILQSILEKGKRLREAYGINQIHDLERLVMDKPEGTTQENRTKLYIEPMSYNNLTKKFRPAQTAINTATRRIAELRAKQQ